VIKKIINKDTLPQFTENSITNKDDYIKELLKVREKGFATDFEEYIRGVNAISVPLTGPSERPVAALWMVGFSHTFDRDKIIGAATDVLQVAVRINEILGSKSPSFKKTEGVRMTRDAHKIAALVLAAGYSSRMGAFKPLLPLGETTVIEKTVSSFLAEGIQKKTFNDS